MLITIETIKISDLFEVGDTVVTDENKVYTISNLNFDPPKINVFKNSFNVKWLKPSKVKIINNKETDFIINKINHFENSGELWEIRAKFILNGLWLSRKELYRNQCCGFSELKPIPLDNMSISYIQNSINKIEKQYSKDENALVVLAKLEAELENKNNISNIFKPFTIVK